MPSPSVADRLFLIGHIARAHGVTGEVKVVPDVSDPLALQHIPTFFLGSDPHAARPCRVASLRFQQTKRGLVAIVRFEGTQSRTEAEALRHLEVYVLEDDLPPLDEGEYYLHDLVGLTVLDEDGMSKGEVHRVLEMPAHPTLVVRRAGRPEVLVPAVPDLIVDIDFEAGHLVLKVIDGLFDSSER